MLRNYLKIATRSLFKNPVYSFINIAGLAIGLAASLLISLWVIDELSFDHFHKNKDRLYQVYLNMQGDNGIGSQRATPLPILEKLKTSEPQIEHAAVTDWGGNHLLAVGEKKQFKDGLYASEDFLKMFSFEVVKGDVSKALQGSTNIVLTESTANALFGTTDALGKTIRVDNAVDAQVAAIVKDVPGNSTFQFDILLPFESYISSQSWVKNSLTNWENNSFQQYVELKEGANKETVEARVKDIVKKNSKQSEGELMFHPLLKWRLYSKLENGKSVGGAIEQVRMFAIIAIFILVIACINFMNLATARSEKRAREVGIRKTVGSRRKELIFQFLGESVLVAFIAFVVAICIAELALPFYNDLVGKKLFIGYANPNFWMAVGAIVLITGLVSGSYPAFYLSSFNAATVLKGKIRTSSQSVTPRKVLVTLQFFFSIFLIFGTIVFNQQMEFGKKRELGYDQERLISIENQGDIQKNYKVIKNELLRKNLATSVTESNSPVTAIYAYMGDLDWKGKRENQRASFATIATSYDYAKTMGIKITEGRDFSEEFNDSLSMIINKAAVEYMGLKNPIGEKIKWNDKEHTIIGVTDNVLMASIYQTIDPMMTIFDPSWFSNVTIRLPKDTDLSATLAGIESVFKEHNPEYPFSYQFADQEFERKFSRIQMITGVANVFAILAIFISCLGLFGLAAFTAEQRTKEIGIRKVMGATISNVVLLLSKDFARLVIIAFALAAPLGWWLLNKWLQDYPYRIQIQWYTVALAGGLALALALVTVSSQALKAAMSNPSNSLRSE